MIKTTYNPILRTETYKSSFFAKIPLPGMNSVILLTAGDDFRRALCIRQGADIKPADVRRGNYSRLIEIDTSSHYIEVEFSLLSMDNVSSFILKAGMTAAVTDPIAFMEEGITDAAARVEMELKPVFQGIADEYEIEDMQGFREAVRSEMEHFTLAKCGLSLSGCNITVRGDEAYQKHLRQKKDITQNVEIEKTKAISAQQISQLYEDPVTAIFSDVAAEKITAQEALMRLRNNKEADFEEGIKRAERVIDVITKMRDSGVVSEEQVQKHLMPLLGELISGTGFAVSQISGDERQGIEKNNEDVSNASAFDSFDEE